MFVSVQRVSLPFTAWTCLAKRLVSFAIQANNPTGKSKRKKSTSLLSLPKTLTGPVFSVKAEMFSVASFSLQLTIRTGTR